MNGSKQVGSRAVERSCKSRSQRNSKPEEIDIAVKYGAGNRLTYHLGGGTGGIEIFRILSKELGRYSIQFARSFHNSSKCLLKKSSSRWRVQTHQREELRRVDGLEG